MLGTKTDQNIEHQHDPSRHQKLNNYCTHSIRLCIQRSNRCLSQTLLVYMLRNLNETYRNRGAHVSLTSVPPLNFYALPSPEAELLPTERQPEGAIELAKFGEHFGGIVLLAAQSTSQTPAQSVKFECFLEDRMINVRHHTRRNPQAHTCAM